MGSVVGAIFVALIGSLGGAIIWADDWSVVQAVVFVWFLALILFLVIVSKIGMGILAVAWAGGFALAGGLVSSYCARLVLVGNYQFTLLQQMAAFLIERGGTSFHHANLTDANFQTAELKSTDLRKANLTCTCWFQTKKLNLALVKATYLEKLPVQELVTTRQKL